MSRCRLSNMCWLVLLTALIAAGCSRAPSEEDIAGADGHDDAPAEALMTRSISVIMPAQGELEFSSAVKVTEAPFFDVMDLGLDCDTPSEPANAIAHETYEIAGYEGALFVGNLVYGYQFETDAQASSYFDVLAESMRSCDLVGNYESMNRLSTDGRVRFIQIDPVAVESPSGGARGRPVSILQGGAFVFAIVDRQVAGTTVSEKFAHAELVDFMTESLGLSLENALTQREPKDISGDPRSVLHALMLSSYDSADSAILYPFALAGGDAGPTFLESCGSITRPRRSESFAAIAYADPVSISGAVAMSSARPDRLNIAIVDVGADGDAEVFMDKLTIWRTQCFSANAEWRSSERQLLTTASGNQIEVIATSTMTDDWLSLTMVDGTYGMELLGNFRFDDTELADQFIERRDFAIDAFLNRPGR